MLLDRVRLVRLAVWAAWKACCDKHAGEDGEAGEGEASHAAPDPARLVTAVHINELFRRGICHPLLFDAIPGMLLAHLPSLRVRILCAFYTQSPEENTHPLVSVVFRQSRYDPSPDYELGQDEPRPADMAEDHAAEVEGEFADMDESL